MESTFENRRQIVSSEVRCNMILVMIIAGMRNLSQRMLGSQFVNIPLSNFFLFRQATVISNSRSQPLCCMPLKLIRSAVIGPSAHEISETKPQEGGHVSNKRAFLCNSSRNRASSSYKFHVKPDDLERRLGTSSI